MNMSGITKRGNYLTLLLILCSKNEIKKPHLSFISKKQKNSSKQNAKMIKFPLLRKISIG